MSTRRAAAWPRPMEGWWPSPRLARGEEATAIWQVERRACCCRFAAMLAARIPLGAWQEVT
eukprot:2698723-Alexandrium_andersonii.AAC.1